MFFREDKIAEKLKCPMCDEKLQDPVLLPCAEFACESCVNDYIQKSSSNDHFMCCLCNEEHPISSNGFPKSKRMKLLLEEEAEPVKKGVFIEKFQEDLDKCMREINVIKNVFDRKEETIRSHYELLRHQIQLATESKIEEINKISKQLLDKVDGYEKTDLKNLQESEFQAQILADLKVVEQFCNEWTNRLMLPQTSEKEVRKDRAELDDLLKFVEIKHLDQGCYIYNKSKLSFDENQDEMKGSLLGDLNFKSVLSGTINVNVLAFVSKHIDLDRHLLIDFNRLNGGCFYVSWIHNYKVSKQNEKLKLLTEFFKPSGEKISGFVQNLSNRFHLANIKCESISSGDRILTSIYFPSMKMHLMKTTANKFKESFFTYARSTRPCKITMDKEFIYLFDPCSHKCSIFDSNFLLIESFHVKKERNYLFSDKIVLRIVDGLLYACSLKKIDVYKLSTMELKESHQLEIRDCPISTHISDDYFILRYKDHLKYISLENRETCIRLVNDLDLSDPDLQIRTIDAEKFAFFDPKTNKYFISS